MHFLFLFSAPSIPSNCVNQKNAFLHFFENIVKIIRTQIRMVVFDDHPVIFLDVKGFLYEIDSRSHMYVRIGKAPW